MTSQILDCTLRDGAHINHGQFGIKTANAIARALISANIQMVELGFLEPQSAENDTTFFRSFDQCADYYGENILDTTTSLGLMLRTDRCPIEALKKHTSIQFIRVAFYPEHLEDVRRYLNYAKDIGYETYANLISVTRYSESEIHRILESVSDASVDGVSIVDTYGCLDRQKLSSLISLFDDTLPEGTSLGLHLHENLSESVSMIDSFYKSNVKRAKIYDGALGGMGRVPGNIPTELLANYLNKTDDAQFKVDSLLRVAAAQVFPFRKCNTWGYLPIYAYSAIKQIDRSYPEYFEACGLSEVENMKCQDVVASEFNETRFNKNFANQVLKELGFDANPSKLF